MLACGYVLLNESADARNMGWLDQQAKQMEQIAAVNGRTVKCAVEIRAINPDGFEEHKSSLNDLNQIEDLVDRFEKVGDDWPIYAVLTLQEEKPASKKQKKEAA